MKKITQILEGVFLISAGRSNVYLLVGDTLALIDTGLPGEGEGVLMAIQQLGRRPDELTHILITHAHMDHMGSLAVLQRATGAKVVANNAEVEYIQGTRKTWTMGREGFGGKLFKAALLVMETFVFKYEPVRVDISCQGGETIGCGGGIQVLSSPGHSPGSLSYYHREKRLLFTGDALSGVGGLRLPPRMGCEDYDEALRSVTTLVALDFECCLFGHGEPLLHRASEEVRKLLKG